MLTRFYDVGRLRRALHEPDLQAYRTDRFTGWSAQPEPNGPVLFSNTSPSYANLTPVASAATEAASGGELTAAGGSGGLIAVIVMRGRARRAAGVWARCAGAPPTGAMSLRFVTGRSSARW